MPLDNPEEQFYWVDEHDNVLGKISRKEAHSGTKKIHRVVGVLVWNDEGELLVHQRSMKKDMDPGMWSISCGGHATFGDTYDATANKELEEEIGISSPVTFVDKFLIEDEEEIEFSAIYQTKVPKDTLFRIDTDEVDTVRWVKKSELSTFINNNSFSQWAKDVLEKTGNL